MSRNQLRELVERNACEEGVSDTGLNSVQLYRVSAPIERTPAVYTPRLCLNVAGSKRGFHNSKIKTYDESHFVCCTLPLPVDADVPKASKRSPLLGVLIEFAEQLMTETVIENPTENAILIANQKENASLIANQKETEN